MSESEARWLQGARELDEAALSSIYDAFSTALYRYAFRFLGEQEAAEDIVAETFYRFLRTIGAGGGPEKHLKAYLYRVAHNLIVDRFRRNTPIELSLDPNICSPSRSSEDPAKRVEMSNEQAEMRRHLWKLTVDQRQVIVLKYFEGLSNQEVSEVLGKPVGAVKSLQHRGLDALRRMLGSNEG
jgi:RNA polymerase sigma-70 factor (ECF subfamily)